MIARRQIIAAFMAALLAWVGAAAPMHAHTHDVSGHHASDSRVISVDFGHAHAHSDLGHDDPEVGEPLHDEQMPHDHEKGVFHVHTMTFVAVEAEVPQVAQASVAGDIDLPILVVPLHTRSVLPPDRPPRFFL